MSISSSILRVLAISTACAVGLIGCDAASYGAFDPAPAGGGKADTLGGADGPVLAEAYALRVTSHVEVRKDDGEIVTHTTEVVALTHTEQDGADVRLTLVPCAVELPASDRDPQLKPGVVESLDPVSVSAVATVDSEGLPILEADFAALLAGVALDDPLRDAMPEDPDDERFVDQDGDGRPGISVGVSAFTVFAAARVAFALSGEISPEATIEGDADLSLDFAILGDTIPFVDARERAEESAESSEVLSRDNHFLMVPLVEPSCAAALGEV